MADPVSVGLIGGIVGAMLIVLGGGIALSSNTYQGFTVGWPLFIWMTLLTAVSIGQLFLTYTLSTAISENPRVSGTGET
jgi:hypothetical protein